MFAFNELNAKNHKMSNFEQALFITTTFLRQTDILNKSNTEKSIFVNDLRYEYPKLMLKNILAVIELKPNTYYYQNDNVLQKENKYTELEKEIEEIFEQHNKMYGYRRITIELHNRGWNVNHKLVRKLMKKNDLICQFRPKRRYRSFFKENPASPNILERKFTTILPNKKIVTDVTEFHKFGKKIFLSVALDLFNGEVIAYTIDFRPSLKMVLDMTVQAIEKTGKNVEMLLHSDQGWQYRMPLFRQLLSDAGIVQSMSRKGNCWDNAVMENFFGLMKSEMFDRQHFENIDDLLQKINNYIHYYNNDRIKTRLKTSPVLFRKQWENELKK